jgi:transposase
VDQSHGVRSRPPRRAPPSTSPMRPGCARRTMRGRLGRRSAAPPVVATTRRSVRGQPDLGRHRQGQAALCRLRRPPERSGIHRFCRRLLHDTPGPVVLVLDGHPVHRSKAVKAFAASTDGRLRLCFLPGYAPELNPDEWVWKHVKHDRIGRAGVTGPDDLKAKALAALHRLRSCRIWCRASCGIRTCVTSPPEQSTYIRLGNFAGLRPATNRWHRRYHPLAADGHTSSGGGSTLCWQ